MRLIFGQPVDKIEVESPIIFSDIQTHGCLAGRRGVSGVMSDFGPIDMKFGMGVEFDELNDYPKFGYDELISCPERAQTKKFSQCFSLVPALTVDVIVP